jgi:hypothetical protein
MKSKTTEKGGLLYAKQGTKSNECYHFTNS